LEQQLEGEDLKRMVMEKDAELRALSRSTEKTEEKMEALKKDLAQRNTSIERLQATILDQRQELDAVKGVQLLNVFDFSTTSLTTWFFS